MEEKVRIGVIGEEREKMLWYLYLMYMNFEILSTMIIIEVNKINENYCIL